MAKKEWPRPMSRQERERFDAARGVKTRSKRKAECVQCRKVYYPKKKAQRFCSKKCREEYMRSRPTGTSVRRVAVRCERCQDVFFPIRNNQKFCSPTCRFLDAKDRQKDRQRKKRKLQKCVDDTRELVDVSSLFDKKMLKMLDGDKGIIIRMLLELEEGDGLCAYVIGERLGYSIGSRTVYARRLLEYLEVNGVIESFRNPKRDIWLRRWRMVKGYRS